jgi:ABC-type bacteriocin/lantibiotic exporter with double-glycine peptidase domain
MGIAQFVAFTAVAATAGNWLQGLSQRFERLRLTAAGAERLDKETSAPAEDLLSGDSLTPGRVGDIQFDNVRFAYGGAETPALDGCSFTIKAGEMTAIVGGSGSGKSTALKLLLGLYRPQAGSITIGGRDISELSAKSLREGLAYVPQDSFMFPETIGEGVSLSESPEENPDRARLEQACADAGILEFIRNLPDGFETVLTEAADNVSGGQRQRIAIARALYRRGAGVLLMDEATASLDTAAEEGILETLKNRLVRSEGRTVIMSAHRRRVIAACDSIIVMEAGKAAGAGKHEELLVSCPEYAALYEAFGED